MTYATDATCPYHCCAHYRNYHITYWAKPIPDRRWDYDFHHDDYDGAPDGYDPRCGSAGSVEECQAEIDMIEGDLDEENEQQRYEAEATP